MNPSSDGAVHSSVLDCRWGYVAVIVTKPIVTTLTHRTHDAPRWCTKGLGSAWRNHETPGWI